MITCTSRIPTFWHGGKTRTCVASPPIADKGAVERQYGDIYWTRYLFLHRLMRAGSMYKTNVTPTQLDGLGSFKWNSIISGYLPRLYYSAVLDFAVATRSIYVTSYYPEIHPVIKLCSKIYKMPIKFIITVDTQSRMYFQLLANNYIVGRMISNYSGT